MTTRKYRWALWTVLGLSFVLMHYFGNGEVGFSSISKGERTLVSVSTHPVLMLWALIVVGTSCAFYRRQPQIAEIGSVGLARRFLSFAIDFYLTVFVEGSFMALVPLAFEAKRTGRFAWSFVREYSVSTDPYVFVPLGLFAVLSLPVYIGLAMTKGWPSVGEFLTGILVRPTAGQLQNFNWSSVFRRMFWAGIGAGLWPYTLLRRRDKNGRTWYDRMSDCDVAHVNYL